MLFFITYFFAYFKPNLNFLKMKNLIYLFLVAAMAFSCQSKETKSSDNTEPEANAKYVLYEVEIEGMTCTGCESTIETSAEKVEGVGSVKASHVDGKAQVKFVEGKIDISAVKKVIEESGYKVIGFKEIDGTDPAE